LKDVAIVNHFRTLVAGTFSANTRDIRHGPRLSSTEHAVYGPLERLAADARNSAKDVKSRR
jgi:hypothetical protein